MAWSTPSSRSAGTLITAAIWNQDVVDNPVALRTGGIAISSQAANDFVHASSSTQLARVAATTAFKFPRVASGGASWEMVRTGDPRVGGTTSDAAPTPNADTQDIYALTALATAPTFGQPSGTPVNGQKLIIRIKDNGSARALAWNAIYVAGGTPLPTTTVISKILTIGFIYNTDNSLNKWQCVAVQQEQ